MNPGWNRSRLADALFSPLKATARRLHEREILRAEQTVLGLLVDHRGSDTALATARAAAMLAHNHERLAALERDPINRAAMLGRSALHRLPSGLRKPLSAFARRTVASPASSAPAAADRPPARPAVAAPFGSAFPSPSLARPVGVVAHIFYPDLAAEIREYLEFIPGAVDVHLSTDSEAKRAHIAQAFSGWRTGQVDIRLAPNRGRDVAPKLITFRDVYERHEVVLHVHSKKSPHDSDLSVWRDFIFESLMGPGGVAASILAAFERFPELGLVAPQHYFPVSNGILWGGNWSAAAALARRMGLTVDADGPLDFPSGSMFWARSAALKPLLDLQLTVEDFPPEAGQEDNTLAHAIERLYFHACERAGLKWIKVGRPQLAAAADGPPSPIADEAALGRFLMDQATPLLR